MLIHFILLQKSYKSRVTNVDKAEVSELAIQWGFTIGMEVEILDMVATSMMEDGKKQASLLIDTYQLKPGMKILDVGCGKGF